LRMMRFLPVAAGWEGEVDAGIGGCVAMMDWIYLQVNIEEWACFCRYLKVALQSSNERLHEFIRPPRLFIDQLWDGGFVGDIGFFFFRKRAVVALEVVQMTTFIL
jgi:hypothetical protein